MVPDNATLTDMPALIQESRQVYETEPVAAAIMLHKGFRALKRTPTPTFNDLSKYTDLQSTSYDESILQTALWCLDIMGEEARLGIAPTPSEWDLNISVAESIMKMMETSHDPT